MEQPSLSLRLQLELLELILRHNADLELHKLSFSGPIQKQMAEFSRNGRNQRWDSFHASITPSESARKKICIQEESAKLKEALRTIRKENRSVFQQ